MVANERSDFLGCLVGDLALTGGHGASHRRGHDQTNGTELLRAQLF